MSDFIIQVKDLGKCYRIRHQQERQRYVALRDVLADKTKSIARRLWSNVRRIGNGRPLASDPCPSPSVENFWALRNVSFEVKQGEVVGIIGRNGAGKSTLLKILSRITGLTEGRVHLKGRVASLLEVGTGFHPELTGRENIFLNGAILGMTRLEIRRRFDEIVSFAEVEKFLDTPVKRYSSGMYVRLAFAVAAHVEPEVLLVDEVLAVGDIQFQKKCLGKMQDASRNDGRTVLFVSHNMAAVQQMCGTAILLRNGRVHRNGPTASVIAEYARSVKEVQETGLAMRVDRHGNGNLKFTSVSFHDCIGAETQTILSGMSLRIRLHYDSEYNGAAHYVDVAVKLTNESGLALTTFANIQTGQTQMRLHRRGYLEVEWPKVNLRSGEYDCVIYVAVDGDVCDWLKNAFAFRIEDGDFYGTGAMISRDHGDVLCDHAWRSVPVAAGLPVAMRQQETAGKCAPKDLGDGDPSLTP